MAGPWFCILGGIFLSKAVVESLTDLIPLTINLRAFNKKKRIAQLFYSLSQALLYLNEFYQNLTLEKSLDHRFFPYVWHFQSDGNNTISFTYVCELSDDPTRTIWKGTHEDGRSIVIKYTSKYCSTAHNICANAGFIPGLLYCSDNAEAKRFGGFRMIIIEYIDGITLDQRFDEDTIDASYCLDIYRDVKSAIIALHKENFVFADLRFPNILIFETVDEMHANLIDFDWCGKHNVDSYPSSMNEDIPWPLGAEPDALLKKAHDLYWLDVLCMFFKYVLFLSFNNLCVILTYFILYISVCEKLMLQMKHCLFPLNYDMDL
jgi:serine/threonine protein kinase